MQDLPNPRVQYSVTLTLPDPKACQSPGYPASNRWPRRAQTQIGYYIFSITPTWARKILAKN